MELNRETAAKFTFATEPDSNGTTVIHLGGEVDLSNVDQLRPQLDRSLENKPDRIVMDLTDLTFFDSSGIALLIEASEKVPTLELRNPSTLIQRIVEATGLSDVLKVES